MGVDTKLSAGQGTTTPRRGVLDAMDERPEHRPGRKRARTRPTVPLAVMLLLGLVALGGLAGALPSPPVLLTTASCAPPASTSPSSILIPEGPPSGTQASFSAGAIVGASYEYQIPGSLPALKHPGASVPLYLPSLNAEFRLSGGSTWNLFFPPKTVYVTHKGWNGPVAHGATASASGSFSNASATLSSHWLAVMANSSYGAFQVEFQWRWTLQANATSPVQNGPWSAAVTQSTTTEQPTTFYPAPLVRVLAHASVTESPNATYWINLTAPVSGTSFRLLVESSTGKELNSVCTASPVGATYYNDTIPLAYANGTALPAASYVVHVHDSRGAIVAFEKVRVS